ncbi:MAG TPA: response regulator, partial [Chloroflexota bacterium]|nr:response regulator [Chloroflexota bacterium]
MPLILIVEDDASTRELVRHMLEHEVGVELVECGNAEDALDWLSATDRMPSLLIVDLMLPGLDGESFMRAVRARYGPELPIMVFSAMESSVVHASAQRAEAQAVVLKPFEMDTL